MAVVLPRFCAMNTGARFTQETFCSSPFVCPLKKQKKQQKLQNGVGSYATVYVRYTV